MGSFIYTVSASSVSEQSEKQRYIVTFDGAPGLAERAMIRAQGGEVIYNYSLIPAMAVTLSEQAVQGLERNPHVVRIEQDQKVHATDIEMDNSWGVKRIGSSDVHDGSLFDAEGNNIAANKGAGVKIGIIDSGINYLHPDLYDNYAGGYDFAVYDTDPMDVYGHGTHVAGTACAVDNNNGSDDPDSKLGVIGVAPECDLYSLRVLNDDGVGYETDIMAAIEWALGREITLPAFGATPTTTVQGIRLDVVNLSLGRSGEYLESSRLLFEAAANEELVIVAAAGNSGNPAGRGVNTIYPAKYESVIAVGATDINDDRATFSSTGPEVELAAPGADVYSTWNDELGYYTPVPVCTGELVDVNGDGELDGECYKYGSGTSMASPHVAGVATLIIAAGVTDGQIVREILQQTALDLGEEGRDPRFGFGLVDAAAAVIMASGYNYNTAPNVDIIDPVDGAVVQGTITLVASASDDSAVSQVEFFADGITLGVGSVNAEGNYALTWTTTPDNEGSMQISAVATDDDVESKTATDNVTIIIDNYNEAPIADAGDDREIVDIDGSTSETVVLDGSGSYDPDPLDSIVFYEWKEGETVLGNGVSLVVDLGIGEHIITLTISDGELTASNDVLITITEQTLDPSTKFFVGDRIMTTANLYVRSEPNGAELGIQPRKSTGTVVGGPVWADGYWWWEINYDNDPDGWSVERYLRKLK